MNQCELNSSIIAKKGNVNKAYQKRLYYRYLKEGVRTLEQKKFYIEKFEKESELHYINRLNRTEHYDVVGRAAEIYASVPFEKEPLIKSNDDWVKGLVNNFDIRKQSLAQFGQDALLTGLWDGMTNVFVDYDSETNEPYCFKLENDNINEVYYNHRGEITFLKFMTCEDTIDPDNIFNTLSINTSWIFVKKADGVYYQKFTQNSDGDYIDQSGLVKYLLDYIPLITYYPIPVDFKNLHNPKIPLEALAHKNIEHLRSNTDQRNILHVTRVPKLVGVGFSNDGGLIVSESGLWCIEGDPESKHTPDIKYVEPSTGKAMEAGRQDILDILQQMEVLGLSVLNKKSNITATATNIDDKQNSSIMTSYAKRLQDFLNEVVQTMVDVRDASLGVVNKKTEFKVEIDTIYSDYHDQARIQYMQFLVQNNIASPELALNYGKKIGVVDSDVDYEDEQEKILSIGISPLNNTQEQQ